MVMIMQPLGGKTARLPKSRAISATNVRGVTLTTDPPIALMSRSDFDVLAIPDPKQAKYFEAN